MRSPVVGWLAVLLEACAQPPQPTEGDAVRARAEPPPEHIDNQDSYLFEVSRVLPNTGASAGGDAVELTGGGFVPGTEVWFGDSAMDPDTMQVFPHRIVGMTPSHTAGAVAVTLRRYPYQGVLENAFRYYDPLVISSVSPAVVQLGEAPELAIVGSGFTGATTVSIGALGPFRPHVSATLLTLPCPLLGEGTYDVAVANQDVGGVWTAAITVVTPLFLHAATPPAIAAGAPARLVLTGAGFTNDTWVAINDAIVQPLSVTARKLEVLVEVGTPGRVQVRLSRADDVVQRDDLVLAYAPERSDFLAYGVVPEHVRAEVESEITVVGSGFDAALLVLVDGVPASCGPAAAHELVCRVRLTPGAHAVAIEQGEARLSVGDLTAVPLAITSLSPDDGAIAGGALVRVIGVGLSAEPLLLLVDGLPMAVRSRSDPALVAVMPPHRTGAATIVLRTNLFEASYADAFSYFDPHHPAYLSHGGPISGEVNVTVVTQDAQPVSGAYVRLGLERDPRFFGLTDRNGQLTLSHLDAVVGPQTVTAAKLGHRYFTWYRVDARNLTLILNMPLETESMRPWPSVLRGNIFRRKDTLNSGEDLIRVRATQLSPELQNPEPGVRALVQQEGSYELFSRPGPLVVTAQAGPALTPWDLTPIAMGFSAPIEVAQSSGAACDGGAPCAAPEECFALIEGERCLTVQESVDILVNTPLSRALLVHFVDPPERIPGLSPALQPDTLRAQVYLDLGPSGVCAVGETTRIAEETHTLQVMLPAIVPAEFGNVSLIVHGGTFSGFADAHGGLSVRQQPPRSEQRVWTESSSMVVLDSLLGYPVAEQPVEPSAGLLEFAMTRPLPPNLHEHLIASTDPLPVLRWRVLSGGDASGASAVGLAELPAELRLESGEYLWAVRSLLHDGLRFDALRGSLLPLWQSRSEHMVPFFLPARE